MPIAECPNCGAKLSNGLCPRCLVKLGIDGAGSARDQAGSTFDLPARPGSVLETIGATIGGVPRVLLRDTAPGEEPSPIIRPTNGHETSTRYRIDGEIARGGMGSILKGRDPDLGRDLAIKVLREDLRENGDLVRRFVEEAQIGGQLQHPGVVPIYELGTFADRRPFFSMKLVKGHTLAQLLEQRPDPSTELPRHLSIFESICQTVAYAHARGVIHRDLKPSNVMVGSFGEVQVMDWGLAKVLQRGGVVDDATAGKIREETVIATARSGSDDPEMSHVGSVMGTPSYMAPEQARGEVDQIDERVDVFALGSILCEILTGQPAFIGRKSGEILRNAALGDTADALARLDAGGADADLIKLAKHCLARERDDRPRDANAVSERITAYLVGVQERMRRAELTSVEERGRRRLTTVVAAGLLALTTAGGLGLSYFLQQRQATSARVALALKEASLLRDQAIDHPDDPARWPSALDGLKRAEKAVAEGGDPEARHQLALLGIQVQDGAKAADNDKSLLAKLIDIRSARADDPDGSATDSAYAAAFRDAGYDIEGLDAKQVAARIKARPEPVRRGMIAALDHWTGVRKGRGAKGEAWPKLVAVARAADPDPDRDALRASLAVVDKPKRLEQLRPLVERADAQNWSPASLVLLASTLEDAGDVDAGVRVLRRASGVHPTDARVHYFLGSLLQKATPPRPQEAIEAYAAARAIQPELAHELAHALEKQNRNEEAEAVFRDLVGRRPSNARHLGCLGQCLKESGHAAEAGPFLEQAIAKYRKAIEIEPKDAMAHYNLGRALSNKGQVDEAVAEYRKAIEIDSKLAQAHYNLGNALKDKGQVDEAIAEYRKAIEIDPKNAKPHTNLGIALTNQGQVDEAIAEYHLAIEIAPKDAMAHYNLGIALFNKGQVDEAISEYHKAIELKPKFAAAHSNLGFAMASKGQLDEAIAEYHLAIELEPKDTLAHSNLGAELGKKGQVDKAIGEFRKAIEIDPRYAKPHYNLGIALGEKGQVDEAIAEYRKAIEIEPREAKAHYELGGALYNKRQFAEAIAEYRKAIEIDPRDAKPHYNLGLALTNQGQVDEAIAEWRLAIESDPKLAVAHYNLGNVLNGKGQADEAIAELRLAIELDPRFALAHSSLGRALSKKDQFDEAIAEYRKAIEIDPRYANAHGNLGDELNKKGQVDEAIAEYRKAIEIDPKSASAHNGLGVALPKKGRVEEGIAEYRKAIEIDPRDAKTHSNLGNALSNNGQVDEAIAEYHLAIELEPKYALAHCNLGIALRRRGSFGEALTFLRRGHELGIKQPRWPYPSAEWVRETESMVALEGKLTAFLKGEYGPADNTERLGLAGLCGSKKRNHAAARLYVDAFAADPKMADDLKAGHRYNAACHASLAAGQGEDAAGLDDTEKARLRKQALDWLRADLTLRTKPLETGQPAARAEVQQEMTHWRQDSDLASVRNPDALVKLPEAERKEWQALWAEVDSLLAKVSAQ